MPALRSVLRSPTGRLRTPWRLLVACVLFVGVNLAVVVVFASAGFPVDPGPVTGRRLAAALVVFTLNGVAVSVAVVVAARYLDHRRLVDFGLPFDDRWWTDFGVGAAVGVGLVGGAYVVGLAAGVYGATLDPSAPGGYPLVAWLALATATMLAVGVYEELLLRGYLLTNLAEGFTRFVGERTAVAAALGVSSVGFGLLHGLNPNAGTLGLLTITLAGLLLGLGYVLTGSLALPIGVHVTWNLTHVLLGLPVSGLDLGIRLLATDVSGPELVHGGAFGPEGGLLGIGATAGGCLLVVWYAHATGRGIRTDVAVPTLREREQRE